MKPHRLSHAIRRTILLWAAIIGTCGSLKFIGENFADDNPFVAFAALILFSIPSIWMLLCREIMQTPTQSEKTNQNDQ